VADIGIFFIVLLSAAMSYFRGLVRELGTIFTWVSAAIIAFFLFPYGREFARGVIPIPLIADIAAGLVLFALALLPMILLASLVLNRFAGSAPGPVDRWAGVFFGIVRGLFLVAIAYWASLLLVPQGKEPAWIRGAVSLPLIKAMAVILPERSLYDSESENSGQDQSGADERGNHEGSGNANPGTPNILHNGYPQNDRRSLDQLITTTNEE